MATEPSVTCKVQVVPMDPNGTPGGGDAQKGLQTKSLSQGKLVQVSPLAVRSSVTLLDFRCLRITAVLEILICASLYQVDSCCCHVPWSTS